MLGGDAMKNLHRALWYWRVGRALRPVIEVVKVEAMRRDGFYRWGRR